MDWWWLTIPFVSYNCPPWINVIKVVKVTRHYWVDSDPSCSISLSPHTHTYIHTYIHTYSTTQHAYPTCELVRWIWRAYLWAMGKTVDFCRGRNNAYIVSAMLVLAAVDCLLSNLTFSLYYSDICCMCKVLPIRFIANWVAKVTIVWESTWGMKTLNRCFVRNKKLRIAVSVLML